MQPYITLTSYERTLVEAALNCTPEEGGERADRWLRNPDTVNFAPTHSLLDSGPAGIAISAIVQHNHLFPTTHANPTERTKSYFRAFKRRLAYANCPIDLHVDQQYGTVGFVRR